ncbi:ABC transporter ATP-binding protein [Propionicicella superfundia]|uniref:ABC transporter ATP-binding protein n=1 Tax=Propionicicella superfundia TaxID=348582 RepID=UPI00042812E3|nr:ABC transporter ATP-binding protein [Propionicicella superfundia]
MGLEVSDLRIRIGRRELVHGVTFDVPTGERLGIIGESGSGKTLTVLAVLGLLPEGATAEGSVRWNGRELLGLPDRDLALIRGKELGVVFQDPSSALNPIRTVGAQIGESLSIHYDLDRRELRQRVLAAAARVGLPDPEEIVRRYPHQLSGGQRQRVAIAMAVASGPRLLVADEPTTALDVTVQAGILRLFDDLVGTLGSSLVFVTHDIALLGAVTDHVVVMADGRIVESGRLDTVVDDPREAITAGLVEAARVAAWDGGPVA